jgi:Flp pilus assembly protein TadG
VSRQAASSCRREGGTASVELIAVVPFLLLAVLVAAQIGLAGQAMWSAAAAARAGARAALVGRDPEVAAKRALPEAMRAGVEVTEGDAVSVRVVVPRLLPGMPRLQVGAESGLGAVGG